MCTSSAPRGRRQWHAHALVNAWDGAPAPYDAGNGRVGSTHSAIARLREFCRGSFSAQDYRG
jgi:hypothetical protein